MAADHRGQTPQNASSREYSQFMNPNPPPSASYPPSCIAPTSALPAQSQPSHTTLPYQTADAVPPNPPTWTPMTPMLASPYEGNRTHPSQPRHEPQGQALPYTYHSSPVPRYSSQPPAHAGAPRSPRVYHERDLPQTSQRRARGGVRKRGPGRPRRVLTEPSPRDSYPPTPSSPGRSPFVTPQRPNIAPVAPAAPSVPSTSSTNSPITAFFPSNTPSQPNYTFTEAPASHSKSVFRTDYAPPALALASPTHPLLSYKSNPGSQSLAHGDRLMPGARPVSRRYNELPNCAAWDYVNLPPRRDHVVHITRSAADGFNNIISVSTCSVYFSDDKPQHGSDPTKNPRGAFNDTEEAEYSNYYPESPMDIHDNTVTVPLIFPMIEEAPPDVHSNYNHTGYANLDPVSDKPVLRAIFPPATAPWGRLAMSGRPLHMEYPRPALKVRAPGSPRLPENLVPTGNNF